MKEIFIFWRKLILEARERWDAVIPFLGFLVTAAIAMLSQLGADDAWYNPEKWGIPNWWLIIASVVLFCIFIIDAAYHQCQKFERKIWEMEKQRLGQRENVLRNCMRLFGSTKDPKILVCLVSAGVGDLQSNDDVLFVVEKIKLEPIRDWTWDYFLQYVPPVKMLYFFQRFESSSYNSPDSLAFACFVNRIMPDLYAPNPPPLPLPIPVIPPPSSAN